MESAGLTPLLTQKQVDVIFHEDESIEDNGTKVQVVCQLGEKAPAVVVAVENVRAAVTAVGDVIEGVGKIDAWWTWHAYRLPSLNLPGNILKWKVPV